MVNPSSSERAQERPLLLIVEEEEGVRQMMDCALTAHGFNILLAANGDDAIELYRRLGHKINLVLMDVTMSGLSGPQTLKVLQQVNPHVRCCFMSGDTSTQRWPELLALGASRVFPKPFPSLSELVQVIRQLCTERGTE